MYKFFKRPIDFILALIATVILLPLLLPLMITLRLTGEGEIFYLQHRVGKDGRPFELLKFATMLKNSPNIGSGTITLQNDPRVLPFGRFLRKTKINELPQIFNVLKGDIAIVGPRPQTPECFGYFPEDLKQEIMKLRPGITGIGSVVFRDEEAIIGASDKDYSECYSEIMAHKAELEVWYAKNLSFLLDIKLIIATALVILHSKADVSKMFKGIPDMPESMKV
ncbi:Undecaprenyl phosphate N,N'-diacetylbacillosamine 1-phosphate transferase [Sedimentisphaera cyanobacteriorum]|uniref:Undecaprenyl phosphate N,N'-diacetylbacillosamine 1-phosphate transferase n=1 Tax=Sedimentisphaera cyanobacteriorum TaxID=1940790 RepID=A0A1Q2HPH4_9BACT|nr:sugar transferase [Sedimentisphaera cyanobacteriorum]AQQ09145.1 Undecaprenyl phosphate N,N'-diacetylbacillosamine 1-phosphate transferase [Sedimentisphaera cyanobacteriorum]